MGTLEDARIKTVQEDPGWNQSQIRADGVALEQIEADRRRELEEHDASIITGVTGAWKHETGTGVGLSSLSDTVSFNQDESFNVNEAMTQDIEEFPKEVSWEQHVLKGAVSEPHYNVLKDRIRDKREFMLNAEDMGVLPTMGLQLMAEFGNIPNYFTFGLAGLKHAKKMKRFLVSGAVTGTANVAEEVFIGRMYADRTATDYAVAGAMGMGLGWLGTLGGGDPKIAVHMDSVGDTFGKTHMKNSVDEHTDNFRGDTRYEPTYEHKAAIVAEAERLAKVAPKEALAYIKNKVKRDIKKEDIQVEDIEDVLDRLRAVDSTVGAQQISSIHKEFNPEFDPDGITPRMDTDNPTVQAAFVDHLAGAIPQAEKLTHEKFGLASMSQSLHSSENPIVRHIAKELLEFPEGVGRYNNHTAALEADLDFQQFTAHYAPEYQRLKGAWKTLAEQQGITDSFDEMATKWIEGSPSVGSHQMNQILDDFNKLYNDMNEATYKIMRDAGVLEAVDDMDLDHMARNWDGEKFHNLRNEFGDDVVVRTLKDSIIEGNEFKGAHAKAEKAFLEEQELAQAGYESKVKKAQEEFDAIKDDPSDVSTKGQQAASRKEKARRKLEKVQKDKPDVKKTPPDIDRIATRMAQALYNRFLNRASATTADANLLSSANRTLLTDALGDLKKDGLLTDDDLLHITNILDTAGKDHRAQPFKHQMGMKLAHVDQESGLRVLDFMHTDLGSAYASKQRYWLGRAAGARHGFKSEDSFTKAIDQVGRHGSDRGMSVEDIRADKDRLESGWKMIKGQPIEDMDAFGNTAMRVVRKAMATSSLGKLGIVQAGETGRVMAAAGVKNVLEGVPMLRDMFMDLKDGRMDTPMLLDIQKWATGKIGDDHYMNHPDFRADDFGHRVSPAERQLDRMSFWLSKASGWHLVHTQQKKTLMTALGHKWHREFTDGTMSRAQFKDLGVPLHHFEGVKEDMLKHAEFNDEDVLQSLHLGKWKPEHRRTMALMLHRKSANAIQDIIVGETPLWINRGLGKFLGQFRTFSIAALGKQTVHDYRMWKEGDKEAALAFQYMIATSTMAVVSRMAFDAASLPEKDRKKYIANNVNLRNITKRVVGYHGQLSPIVDGVDMLASSVMPNTWGQITGSSMYRNGRGLTSKVPGLSYINRAAKGISGVTKSVLPGEEMSRSDWNAFVGTLPLSSWYGFHAMNKRVVTPLIFD